MDMATRARQRGHRHETHDRPWRHGTRRDTREQIKETSAQESLDVKQRGQDRRTQNKGKDS